MQSTNPSFSERFNAIAQRNEQAKKEEDLEFYLRNASQYGARAAEVLIGLPGNMQKAFKSAWDYLANIHDDEDSYLKYAINPMLSKAMKSTSDIATKPLVQFPTSEDVREKGTKPLSEELFGERDYLEPRSETEKNIGEFSQDLISFFTPGSSQLKLATKIGAPIAGHVGKQALKYLGVEEETAEKAKNGIMLMTTLAGQSNPRKFASQRIQQAKEMIPDSFVDVRNLENNLILLKDQLSRGLKVSSKNKTLSGIDDLLSQIKNGRMNIKDLMESRDSINEWISEAGGWDIPKPVRASSVRNLNKLKDEIIETTQSNLNRMNPNAAELYKTGYEAAAVNHKSHAISNFIERNFGKKFNSTAAKVLFHGGGTLLSAKVPMVAGASYPFYKTGQILYRISQSPTLTHYYGDVIRHSLEGNAAAMTKSLSKLDKELAKEEKNSDYGISLEDFKSKFKNKG